MKHNHQCRVCNLVFACPDDKCERWAEVLWIHPSLDQCEAAEKALKRDRDIEDYGPEVGKDT